MRLSACLSLVLLAATTACASVTDGPTTPLDRLDNHIPDEISYVDDGEPPPPPIDTGGTVKLDGEEAFQFSGRFFENTQNTNSWLEFQDSEGVDASPNARLMYNSHTRRTKGVGTLTVGSLVIDLRLVSITTPRGFAACPAPPVVTSQSTSDGPVCDGIVRFDYGNKVENSLTFIKEAPPIR